MYKIVSVFIKSFCEPLLAKIIQPNYAILYWLGGLTIPFHQLSKGNRGWKRCPKIFKKLVQQIV